MKVIILIVTVFLLSSSMADAQAKVGTTGAQFLKLPVSVKAIGMGHTGASVMSNNSFYINPSHLGFMLTEKNISMSLYPSSTKLSTDVSYFNYSLSFPILHNMGDYGFYFGAAYYATELKSGTLIERTYEQGTFDGTGRTFNWKDKSKNLVLSFASTGNFDYGLGLTIKYFSQSTHSYSSDGIAFDFGGTIRMPIRNIINENELTFKIPTFGFSIQNFGPDMTFINNAYPLPISTTFGFSIAIGKKKYFSDENTADVYRLTPAFDTEKRKNDSWLYKFGLDVSLYEIINFRAGKIADNGSSESITTFGFTLSTFNLGKLILLTSDGDISHRGIVKKFIYERLNIEYNFARYDKNYYELQNFHEIVLSYAL